MFDAARHGEVGQMYPGGRTQRNADIEAGAGRPAALIAADVTATATALEEAWAELPEDLWSASGESVAGPVILRDLPFIRWREAIVHHSDLGLTSTWEQWDPEYVRLELGRLTMLWASRKPMGLTQLPEAARRAPAHRRVAWLLGRTDIDGLDPAGIMG
jgi:maleylpyruvate isomerase